ncbi:hypothetical protein PM3016_1836 [Paenibacillus mucilaginosus 3016]|uniref:Uncharacterized protein n=1 Tax=Paenibacillus mucilaginosus 3016 TaxID=1116391 RepID=H6NH66_9BACL|nr:hypothetical protein PM3016_1836 [Paenibacillus mucilaginosus 3016]
MGAQLPASSEEARNLGKHAALREKGNYGAPIHELLITVFLVNRRFINPRTFVPQGTATTGRFKPLLDQEKRNRSRDQLPAWKIRNSGTPMRYALLPKGCDSNSGTEVRYLDARGCFFHGTEPIRHLSSVIGGNSTSNTEIENSSSAILKIVKRSPRIHPPRPAERASPVPSTCRVVRQHKNRRSCGGRLFCIFTISPSISL